MRSVNAVDVDIEPHATLGATKSKTVVSLPKWLTLGFRLGQGGSLHASARIACSYIPRCWPVWRRGSREQSVKARSAWFFGQLQDRAVAMGYGHQTCLAIRATCLRRPTQGLQRVVHVRFCRDSTLHTDVRISQDLSTGRLASATQCQL